jgi:hypothetical protein
MLCAVSDLVEVFGHYFKWIIGIFNELVHYLNCLQSLFLFAGSHNLGPSDICREFKF